MLGCAGARFAVAAFGAGALRPIIITHVAAATRPSATPIAIHSQFGRTLGLSRVPTEGDTTGCECRLGTEPRSRSASALRRASRISDIG